MTAKPIDYSHGRERIVDYISVAESIAQSYPDPPFPGIDSAAHGVQKDAIQNGWDARPSKRATLRFTFEYVKNKMGKFLVMEDHGIGLTGSIWTHKELEALESKGEELPDTERWARFESFGFMRESAGGIGSRGQGKFLFINTSETKEIVYETRLEDGTYRVGATKASRTGCPMVHQNGKAGERLLAERTGLKPIGHQGTRVIICDVQPTLASAIESGAFLRAIEETWWRNIEKGRAQIEVKVGGKSFTAAVPAVYPLPTQESKGPLQDNGKDIKIWRPDLKKLKLPGEGKFKAFELCYRDDVKIPDELKGVAILHYGMKVTSISPQYLPEFISDRIYGFVEFDEAVDAELRQRDNQKPNHYDLVWSRVLPRTIRQIIRDQIDEFARTKLGQGVSSQQKAAQLQADAEAIALRELLQACRDLGLPLNQRGPTAPRNPNIPPPPPRPVGVMFHDFVWPNPGSRRVEHDDSVEFELVMFNTTQTAYPECHLTSHVFTVAGGHSLRTIDDSRHDLPAAIGQISAGRFSVTFDSATFPPGEYVVRAMLRDSQGYEIDSQSVHIFVAQDPPLRAPFEIVGEDWSTIPDWKNVTHTLTPTPEPKVTYNYKHPRYLDHESGGDVRELAFYIYGLLVQASIQLAVYFGRSSSSGYPSVFNGSKMASNDPYEVVEDIHRVQGLLMAQWK